MTAVRIRKYKVSKTGKRGVNMTIPKVKLADLGIVPGDSVSVYAAIMGGRHVLIISSADEPVLTDETSTQGRELAEFMEANS